ncbi:MAG TPA: phosphatidate cytidylyltransferase [Planktothrix sp.]
MNKRVIFGWILFLLGVISISAGGIILAIVYGFGCYMGGVEFVEMAKAKGYKPSPRIIKGMIIAFFAMAAIPTLRKLIGLPWNFALEHFPMLLLVGICICFIRLLFRQEERKPATIADIATTVLGFIWIGFLPCHLILLRNLQPPAEPPNLNPLLQPGLAYVITSVFTIQATDIFAYVVGKKFGKKLLYPEVSPKKTVEGAIGGFVASILVATICVYLFDAYFPGQPFHGKLWQAPLMGAAVSIAAQIGDLCESLMKRDAGMKDSSTIIPGHGGFLDRGDSLLFGSPIAYYWICLVVLGIL